MATYEMGFINVPISPTFVGIAGKLNDQLIKPARDAGKKAATEVEKSVEASVKGLERQVAASTKKLGDLDRAHQDSVSKREAQQGKLNAAIAEQSAAEEKYQQALKKGDSGLAELAKVEKAKAKVTDETLKLTKAERDITDAEQKHKAQLEDLQRTTAKYEQAQKGANEEAKSGTSVFDKLRQQIGLAGTEMDDTANKAGGLGDKIMSGLGKVGTGALLGVGAKIGTTVMGGIDTAFSSGFGRLASIEQAETMLGGLGHSAEGVTEIMDNAMESVSGTAYSFGEAASMAATFAGAGIEQGEELTEILSLVGDSAAITGADFEEMGSIWTKMASSGKLSTDEMNQLMDRGLGLLPKLQEHYNVTADEARKMVTEGKVSFEDFSEVMEDMVGGSAQAMGETFSGSAANMQAALGRLGAKFLDPIYANAPAIFQAIGGSVDKLGEHLGPLIEDFSERLSPYIEDFAERLGPWLEQTIDDVAERIGELVGHGREAIDWMRENEQIIGPLAVGVASMATAFGLWTAAVKAYNTATEIAATVTKIFDGITKKTVFGAIALAVIGLVSAFVWFFTKTEAGQRMWETFTTALADGWDWVTEKIGAGIDWIQGAWSSMASGFQTAYDGFIKPVFDAFVTAGQVLVAVIGTAVLTPILLGWKLLSAGIQLYWETVVKPVLDAFAALGTWLWESALQPVFTAISDGWAETTARLSEAWQAVSDTFLGVWGSIRDGVFGAWTSYTDMVRANWEIVAAALSAAWQAVGDFFANTWNWIKSAVFDAFTATVEWVRDKFLNDTGLIGMYFRAMADGLGVVKDFIVGTVFGGLGAGLETVQGWFQSAVDGIGKIWDGLKAAAAKPVKFVVDTVWNNGILAAWNNIADFLPGIDTRDPLPLGELGNYATGGVLPGYTPGRDVHTFVSPTGGRIHLSGGEAIMRPEWTQAVGGPAAVERMNLAARTGKLDPEQMQTGHSHAFARGGVWDLGHFANGGVLITTAIQTAMRDIVKAKYPGITLTSATRPGHSGYHGTGHATDWSNGSGNTPMQLSLAHDIAQTYPGSAQLIYAAPGWASNIYEGSPAGAMDAGVYNTAQAGRHDNHVHWAMTQAPTMQFGGGVFEGGSNGGGIGAAVVNWIADKARGIWADIVDPIKEKISGKMADFGDSAFGQIPGAMFGSLKDAAWSKLSSMFGAGGGSNSGSVDVSGISGPVVEQVEAVFARHGFTGDDWEAAKWIVQRESNWNPQAVNPSSGAYGLFQFNPMGGDTLSAYLPDRSPDPAVQADAGARYMKDRYGSPSAAKSFWEQNGWYADGGVINLPELFTRDLGGIVPSGALVRNTSGRDELMLPPETTALLNQFFRDFPEVARALESSVVALEGAAEWLAEAADSASVEGVTARQSARRVLGLGLDLPGAGVMAEFLDAEESLLASRARHLGHLDNLAEKEQALEEARKALADMESSEGGLSKDEQRKLDDAIKVRDEAQANLEQAESEEKRAEATEKLADSEEKLARVREDLDENAEKSAEKHAEEIVKANEQIVKAETDLVEAKKQQVQDLDHMVLVSQGSIMGMIPQVEGLAAQIVGMGAPAAAVGQGLGAVTGALTSVAGMAGPAGISLGMAFDALKIGIELVQMFEGIIKDLVAEFTKWRVARHQVFAEYAGNIAQINALVREQKSRVVDLAAAWVDATAAMAAAVRAVTAASGGVFKAALEGAQGVADVQKRIRDAMFSGSSGGGSSSGSAPWDMGLLYDSYSNQLTAEPRVKKSSSGASTQDVVNGLEEIAALQYDLLAAEINAQVLMAQAALDLLNAQYEQSQAQVALVRLEEDLGRQIRHLNSLQEIQVQFAMNEQQAILAQAYADMAVKVAEAEATNMDLGNRIGAFLDFDGDGKVFGLFTNVGSSSIQAAEAQKEAARAQMEAIAKMAESYGGLPDMGDLEGSIDRAARLIAAGEDAAADMAIWGSELGNPARMLQIMELETTLRNVDENQLGLSRTIEDLRAYWEHLQEVMPLEEEIFSLENERDAHTAQAEALRASSVEVRAAAEALRDFHLQAANAKPQETTLTVVIPSRGQMVDPDDLDAAFSQLGTQIQGLNFRVQRVEDSGKAGAGAALATRK